jgi:hypothetical protein
MHDNEPGRGTTDDRLIDRLVDGELPEDERRALLLRLEAEPDGWRRCALAFLEAQAWRHSLGGLAREVSGTKPTGVILSLPETPRRLLAPRLAAWAAGLLAAFALGWTTAGSSRPHTPQVADLPSPVPSPPSRGPESQKPPTAVAHQEVARPEAAPRPDPAPAKALAVPGPSGRPAGPSTPAVPAYVRSLLERRGYLVEERRGMVIGVSGGRRVVIPAEKVKIRYVGRRTS